MLKILHRFSKNEIQEYIFIDALLNNIYCVLDQIIHCQQPKITNFWVEGALGSGRTYFLKYIYFCLNPETQEEAFKRIIDSVKDLEKNDLACSLYYTAADFTHLLNELKTYSFDLCLGPYPPGHEGVENFAADVLSFYNATLGFNPYNINFVRYVEKPLAKLGLLNEFKRAICEAFECEYTHESICDIATNEAGEMIRLINRIAPSIEISADKIFQNCHIPEITEYIHREIDEHMRDKSENHKVVFFIDMFAPKTVDECIQLHHLTSQLVYKFDNKVWFIFTSSREYSTTECTTFMNKIKDHNSDSIKLFTQNPTPFEF